MPEKYTQMRLYRGKVIRVLHNYGFIDCTDTDFEPFLHRHFCPPDLYRVGSEVEFNLAKVYGKGPAAVNVKAAE